MKGVLLSVIIPTYKRSHFLPRAIDSALLSAPEGDVEVIVVPNGADVSWMELVERYKNEQRVIWSPVDIAHANIARNHGLALAKGRYIRFLDDDDYFYPDNAKEQLVRLIEANADLSFSCIEYVDDEGGLIKKTAPEFGDDYIAAAVGKGNPTATLANVYSYGLVSRLKWDVNIIKRQDVYWAYLICASREFKSVYHCEAVGAWVQHNGDRVSEGHSIRMVLQQEAKQLIALAEILRCQNRLSRRRAQAISVALWQCVHSGTMYSPFFWYRVSKEARALMPGQFPRSVIYKNKYVKKVDPFWFEVMLVPIRWVRVLFGHKYSA